MRIIAVSIICDNNKYFKIRSVSEECFKFCSYENREIVVKCGLKQNKIQYFDKYNRRHYPLQKRGCSIH